jgi:hypothetical protein
LVRVESVPVVVVVPDDVPVPAVPEFEDPVALPEDEPVALPEPAVPEPVFPDSDDWPEPLDDEPDPEVPEPELPEPELPEPEPEDCASAEVARPSESAVTARILVIMGFLLVLSFLR